MVEKLAEDLPKWECASLVETFRKQKIDHKALACLIEDEKEFKDLVKEYGLRCKLQQAMQNITNDSAQVEHGAVVIVLSVTDGRHPDPLIGGKSLVVGTEHAVTGDGNATRTETPPGTPPRVAQQEQPQVAEVGATADTSNRGVKRKRASNQKHSDVKNSVRQYLDKNTTGRKYLGLYNNKGFDKGNTRSDLSQYLVDCEINSEQNPDKVIPPSRFLELRAEIVAVFPKETEATYYIPRKPKTELQGAKQPKGKLYDKYTALTKQLRLAGLRSKGSDKENQENIPEDIDDPDPERDTEDDLQSLALLVQTEGETQALWRKTSAVRLHTLRVTSTRKTQKKQDKAAITKYCDKYKALRSDWGHSLLSIDFDFLYDGTKLCLMQEWKTTIALKIKSMSGLPLVYKDTIQEDVETLLLIPKLFGAINVGKWKVSSSDIQTGFLHHIVNGADLDAEVLRLSSKLGTVGKTLQPFPIIVAEDLTKLVEKPPVFYVYIDSFYYTVRTPLEAIDLCFKAYHALHADYPYQSLHPWLFLQKAVYGIKTQWDPQIPPVERRVNEFSDLDV